MALDGDYFLLGTHRRMSQDLSAVLPQAPILAPRRAAVARLGFNLGESRPLSPHWSVKELQGILLPDFDVMLRKWIYRFLSGILTAAVFPFME